MDSWTQDQKEGLAGDKNLGVFSRKMGFKALGLNKFFKGMSIHN